MPHSSGGGSSSGGSHSSGSHGHHSSGGGSGSRPLVSRTYRPGKSHVFVYYGNGRPSFYYSDYSFGEMKRKDRANRIVMVICLLAGIALGIWGIFQSVQFPVKLSQGKTPCVITDQAGSFTDQEKEDISAAAGTYYEATGIQIVIHTITEEMYEASDKNDLETYAYSDYVRRINDEDSWLLVFEDIDKSKNKWAFEGMQGDNTDLWLTKRTTSAFDKRLTEQLWKSEDRYGGAFVSAIESLPTTGRPVFDIAGMFSGSIVAAAFTICLIAGLLSGNRDLEKLKDYHEVTGARVHKKTGPVLVRCDYCGSTYVYGEPQCPHCGAPGKTSPE